MVSSGFPRFSLGSPKVFLRFSLGFPEVFLRFSLGVPQVFLRFSLGYPLWSFFHQKCWFFIGKVYKRAQKRWNTLRFKARMALPRKKDWFFIEKMCNPARRTSGTEHGKRPCRWNASQRSTGVNADRPRQAPWTACTQTPPSTFSRVWIERVMRDFATPSN